MRFVCCFLFLVSVSVCVSACEKRHFRFTVCLIPGWPSLVDPTECNSLLVAQDSAMVVHCILQRRKHVSVN
ncbi:hypothetical protein HDV63DRAFT_365197 [Trichoderma sp. SZMC 28014]